MQTSLLQTIRRQGGGICLFLWTAALVVLYSHENDFPLAWHWIETSKPVQIVTGDYNFNQPQLLLLVTRAALLFGPPDPSLLSSVIIGRWVSAIAAAGSVFCLTVLAFRLQGRLAAFLTAILVGTTPLLFGLAHYMKEDPLFLFGLSAFLLALTWCGDRPGKASLALLGITAGLTATAKYIGAFTVPVAMGYAMWRSRQNRNAMIRAALWTGGCALAVFLLVDLPILTHRYRFVMALAAEANHAVTDHHGMIRPIWSPFYAEVLMRLCSPVTLVCYGLWLVWVWRERRQIPAFAILVGILPLAFLLGLQAAPVKTVRYALPAIAVGTMLAACAAARLMSMQHRTWLRATGAAAAIFVLGFNAWHVARSYADMVHDTRTLMARWIEQHLPPDTLLAQTYIGGMHDSRISPDGPGAIPLRVGNITEIAEGGSIETARGAGVRYILIADLDFGRLFDPGFEVDRSNPAEAAKIENARAFYSALFKTSVLLYRLPGAGLPGVSFSPGLRLYDIWHEPKIDPSQPIETPTFNLLED